MRSVFAEIEPWLWQAG